MNPDPKALGLWVKARRKELDLTLDELAKRAKCSKGYIHKVENAALHSSAKRPPAPTVEFLDRLSHALGTSIATLLVKLGYLNKAETIMESPATHPIRILNYYNELPEEDQEFLESIAKSLWLRRHAAPELKPKVKPRPKTQKKKTA